MRYLILPLLLFTSMPSHGQPCQLLTETFAAADTIRRDSTMLYRFRFSAGQLDVMLQIPGLEKPVVALRKLQKTLDEDNTSFENGYRWQLDEKLAESQLTALRKECPYTGFKVYNTEINFYKSKYQKKADPVKHDN